MKEKVLRLTLFALFFVIDVRVKAAKYLSLSPSQDIVQHPRDCYEKSFPCAVKTRAGERLDLRNDEQVWVLGSDSAVLMKEKGRVTLVSGLIWVESTRPSSFQTIYGLVVGTGMFWVRKEDEAVTVGVGSGEVRLIPNGNREVLTVKAGVQNWMGPVTKGGGARTGVPQPLVLSEHLQIWAGLTSQSKADFEDEAREFISRWQQRVVAISAQQKKMTDRRLASVMKKRDRAKHRRAHMRKRESEIRRLFRDKNHL